MQYHALALARLEAWAAVGEGRWVRIESDSSDGFWWTVYLFDGKQDLYEYGSEEPDPIDKNTVHVQNRERNAFPSLALAIHTALDRWEVNYARR